MLDRHIQGNKAYHKDESCPIDNIAKVADDVVHVLEYSPRSRTAKVAVALKLVGSNKSQILCLLLHTGRDRQFEFVIFDLPPSGLFPGPLVPA